MQVNNKEISLEELLNDIKPRDNMVTDCGNGCYLSSEQIAILKRYGFFYENYSNVKSLIFALEEYLNNSFEEDTEELEMVASHLAELDYYQNTNK